MIPTNCLTKFQEVNMKKLFLFVLALSGMIVQAQFTIPEKPSFQTSVYDYADVLNPQEEKELENILFWENCHWMVVLNRLKVHSLSLFKRERNNSKGSFCPNRMREKQH